MSWIQTIPIERARGALAKLYERIKGPDNTIDNILLVHSLRPHTLKGHMMLYKAVLHHTGNVLPKWFLETAGIYVSLLNQCDYCVEHHYAGLEALLDDDGKASKIRQALERREPGICFAGPQLALLQYVEKLTREPASVDQSDIAALRNAGVDDGAILEINQVASYFAYANRTVLGLGVNMDGDILGLSPGSEREDDWGHGTARHHE